MKITQERLQEIKEDIKRGRKCDVPNDYNCNYEEVYDNMEELVTALETAQRVNKGIVTSNASNILSLKAAQAELAEANDLYEIADEGMINCGKQLAEMRVEIKEFKLVIGGLGAKLIKIQMQRDELGDSLHNQSPGVPALDNYVPTWAREENKGEKND